MKKCLSFSANLNENLILISKYLNYALKLSLASGFKDHKRILNATKYYEKLYSDIYLDNIRKEELYLETFLDFKKEIIFLKENSADRLYDLATDLQKACRILELYLISLFYENNDTPTISMSVKNNLDKEAIFILKIEDIKNVSDFRQNLRRRLKIAPIYIKIMLEDAPSFKEAKKIIFNKNRINNNRIIKYGNLKKINNTYAQILLEKQTNINNNLEILFSSSTSNDVFKKLSNINIYDNIYYSFFKMEQELSKMSYTDFSKTILDNNYNILWHVDYIAKFGDLIKNL